MCSCTPQSCHGSFCEHGGVEDSPGSGDNLPSFPVGGFCVQRHVVDVGPDGSQVFVTQHTLLGGPLETGHNAVLDLVQVLHFLGAVNHWVGLLVSSPKHQIFLTSVTL